MGHCSMIRKNVTENREQTENRKRTENREQTESSKPEATLIPMDSRGERANCLMTEL